ncbi:hypothetical protein O3G_MSEX012567 [Manduca sexta]|uniref:Uncharacterized protein n=1 Tax=Manduca sexta TaxID=7130 RepID=A0A922CWY9_MANSE|nr:hypothetical protein O3G_MSEX012567 [Manduca sexta]
MDGASADSDHSMTWEDFFGPVRSVQYVSNNAGLLIKWRYKSYRHLIRRFLSGMWINLIEMFLCGGSSLYL